MGAALSSVVQMPARTAEDVRADVADANSASNPSTAMAQEPPAAVAPSAAVPGKAPQAAAKPEGFSLAASAASGSSTSTSSGEETASDVEESEGQRSNPVAAGSGLREAQPAVIKAAEPMVPQPIDSKQVNPPQGRFRLWGR